MVGALAVVAGLVWLLNPRAFLYAGGSFGVAGAVGADTYVGMHGAIRAPVHILWVRPDATDGLEAEVLVCRKSDPNGGIGAGPKELYDAACKTVGTAAGANLRPEPPHGDDRHALVVRLRPLHDGPHAFCGITVLYRSGIRFGFQRGVGSEYAFLHPALGEPPEPVGCD